MNRLSIVLPAGQVLVASSPAVSRGGQFISYVARSPDGVARLYVRALDRFEASEIPGSEGARSPFFSPDATRIGFFARRKLMIAPRAGGTPVAIADASSVPLGATWGDDGAIYYAPAISAGILRVSETGGKPEIMTEPDEAAKGYAHVFPQYLSETRSVLFSVWGGQNTAANGAMLLSPANKTWFRVSPLPRSAIFARSGHLLSSGFHTVTAAAFNPAKPQEVRPTNAVLDDVFGSPSLATSWFAVSDNGTLVYVPGDSNSGTLAWVNRSGILSPLPGKSESMADVTLSPDGTRLAFSVDNNLWVRNLRSFTTIRLTSDDEGSSQLPVWSSNGAEVIFASNRTGDWDLYSVSAAGGAAKHLLARKGTQMPVSASPDGTVLFIERSRATGTGADLWTLAPDGTAAPFFVSPGSKIVAAFSPNGRLVAYVSDETGRDEVYVRAIGSPSGTVPVSSEGGTEPAWSPDGKELFYRRGDAFFDVNVTFAGAPSAGEPHKLFETPAAYGRYSQHRGYSVSPDGKRFLIQRPDPRAIPTQINVVLNWFDELKAKAPAR